MKDEVEKASHTTVTLGIAKVFLSLQLLPAFLNVRQNNMQHELRGLLHSSGNSTQYSTFSLRVLCCTATKVTYYEGSNDNDFWIINPTTAVSKHFSGNSTQYPTSSLRVLCCTAETLKATRMVSLAVTSDGFKAKRLRVTSFMEEAP